MNGICPVCGTTFRYSPSARKTYCSRECANKSPDKSTKSQQNAARQWSNPESRQRLLDGIERRSQSDEWRSAKHFQRGEAHPRYRGNKHARQGASQYAYKKWRVDVFKKDNYTCQVCGVRGGRLQAHHIKSWADNPETRYDVNNGMTVCESCHDKVHGRNRKPTTMACGYCGIRFIPSRGDRQYCSQRCAGKASNLTRMRQPKPCEYCGKTFVPKKAKVRFCSTRCAGLIKRVRVECTCQQCAVVFSRCPSLIEGATFCSQACYVLSLRDKEG